MSKTFRRSLFAFTLGAALTAAVLLGRAAYATDGAIHACFKPSNGTLYLLGEGSDRTECQPGDLPISWNAAGLQGPPGEPGQNGVSVTSRQLAAGDPNCPNGGSEFTSASGVTYACNGADGQDGQDGEDFAGSFTSSSGLFSLTVDDAGVRLNGPLGFVRVSGGGIQIQSSGVVSVAGTALNLSGTPISLNGSGCGVLRPTDVAGAVGPDGGIVLLNPAGSLLVRTTC